jgi:hypothetical protein
LDSSTQYFFAFFWELLLPYAVKHLVPRPFSRRLQELLLVALQVLEKAVGYRHAFFAAVRAKDFVVITSFTIMHTVPKIYNKLKVLFIICKELFIYLILEVSLILSDLSTRFKVDKSDFVRPICKLCLMPMTTKRQTRII